MDLLILEYPFNFYFCLTGLTAGIFPGTNVKAESVPLMKSCNKQSLYSERWILWLMMGIYFVSRQCSNELGGWCIQLLVGN